RSNNRQNQTSTGAARSGGSSDNSIYSGCYCTGGIDFGACDCGDGDDCGIIVFALCVLGIILIVLITASGHLIMSLSKFYKSFSLKSKNEIVFKHEQRQLNTLGKYTC
ncbi:unnamed protein product, partial [Meganyctiphanes norvegica]